MSNSSKCKVDHAIDRYDLAPPSDAFDSMDESLVAQWTGTGGGEAVGYKQLTEWFNKRLLRHVYERQGRETLGTRLESEYDALTGEDDLLRAEVADDLERHGINAEQLQRDMVSWSTMRRHLKHCIGAEKTQPDATAQWEEESVKIARERLEQKTAKALRSLETKGRLPGATEADVKIQVKVSCPECPTRVPLATALDRGFVCETHLPESETVGQEDSPDTSHSLLGAGVLLTGAGETWVPWSGVTESLGSIPAVAVDLWGGLLL